MAAEYSKVECDELNAGFVLLKKEDDDMNEDMELVNTYSLEPSDASSEAYQPLPADFAEVYELERTGGEALKVGDEMEALKGEHLWEVVEVVEEAEEVPDDVEEFIEYAEEEQEAVPSEELTYVPATENVLYNVQYLEDQCEQEIDTADLGMLIKQEEQSAEADADDVDKYYCCECQTVFGDLESAEHHKCTVDTPVQMLDDDLKPDATIVGFESGFRNFVSTQRRTCEPYEMEADANIDDAICNKQQESDQFKCSQCDKVFSSVKGLNSHHRAHKGKPPGSSRLREPEAQPQLPVVCTVCKTTFRSQKNLKLHMKIHNKMQLRSIEQALPAGAKTQYNEMNKFFCEICNKSFEQNLLAIHKNMHQNAEDFNCPICNRHFENQPSYEMHMQMHAGKPTKERAPVPVNSGRQFPCQYCGRAFSRPFEKVRHERVHTGEKPHECEVCGKTFRVSYSLTLHLRTHTEIRPYVCATCNKRFKSQPAYSNHLRTHLIDRPYKCDVCLKSFRTSVQMGAHRNSHLKPYNCPECNRPFASLYVVKIHMKTHSKFNKSHENLKHNCVICGAVYARIFALRLHMKEQHGIDLAPGQTMDAMSNEPMILDDNEDSVDAEQEEADAEAAVLIAAAAEADCGAYIDAATSSVGMIESSHRTTHTINDNVGVMDQVILQNEEIIVDNYQTEEIVADWLTK